MEDFVTMDEIISTAKDVVASLLTKGYNRQDIHFILKKAIEINEDDWCKEEE